MLEALPHPLPVTSVPEETSAAAGGNRLHLAALAILILGGALLRFIPSSGYTARGFDESIYQHYAGQVAENGIASYPSIVGDFITSQKTMGYAVVPPTRVLFLGSAGIWSGLSGRPALEALRDVSAIAAVITLGIAAAFAWRARGPVFAVAVTALLACAPTQISMAQRALVDGVFGTTALLCMWTLWECLRHPRSERWLLALAGSLVVMILTKENALFVYGAMAGVVAVNRWADFGTVTPRLVAAMIAGPVVGMAILFFACGGADQFLAVFTAQRGGPVQTPENSSSARYAIATGGGPWFRYILDLLLVNPVLTLLAVAGFLGTRREDKAQLFLCTMLALTYLVMAQIPYGMNLRYANMWDFALAWLALVQIHRMSTRLSPHLRGWVIAVAVAVVCAIELRQYAIVFMAYPIYDPVPAVLMKALEFGGNL